MTNTPNDPMKLEVMDAAYRVLSPAQFPQYSQRDPRWEFTPGTERHMCGIICMKAVLDFYAPDGSSPAAHELLVAVNKSDGYKTNGISHPVEVDVLKSQGLLAWRRNWVAPSADPAWFIENEGYDIDQIDAIHQQMQEEATGNDRGKMALISIQNSLDDHNPVIASVGPFFGGNRSDHQIVITEMSPDGRHIVIMDPEREPGDEIQTESIDRFMKYFNYKVIFARQNDPLD